MTPEELQQMTKEAEQLLITVRDSVQELTSIKGEVNTLRQTIKSRATESENKLGEIERLKMSAVQYEQKITTALQQVSAIVNDIQKYQPTFQALREKVEHSETGVDALLVETAAFRDDVASLKKETENLLVDIKGRLSDIEKLKAEAAAGRDLVKGLAEESQSLKESIQEHLQLVSDSTLQNAFKEREKTLFWFVWGWLAVSVLSLIGLAGGVLYIFSKLAGNGFQGWHDWYRALFLTPILYLVIWASRNYAQERKLLERYAFKAVVSTSLTAYIKLLTDRFEDAQEEVLRFTKDALKTIFKEPHEDLEANKMKANISLWNVFKADIELDEKTKEKIKEQAEQAAERETKAKS